jgi:hypothetical protein
MKAILGSRVQNHVKRLGIFLITLALITGIVSCDGGASCGGGGGVVWDLTASSSGGGDVVVSGEGTYADGTIVTLEAVADECYEFVKWTGADVADPYSPTTTVTMDEAKSITANFALLSYDLTVDSTDGGQVTSPGEDTFTYDCGAVVALVAASEEGYYFVNWSGDVDAIDNINTPTTTLTVKGDYSATANFAQLPPGQFTLTISSSAGGSVPLPGEGTHTYIAGTLVNLLASPNTGCRFVNWTGDVEDIGDVTSPTITITINRAYSITANFIAQYHLAIDSTDGGEVITPGEGTFTYDAGTVVDLLSEAEAGHQFVNWSGNVSTIADANAATTTITMNHDYSITANFAVPIWDWYDLDAIRDGPGGNYVLMIDLDSTTAGYRELASATAHKRKGWQPIGSMAVNDAFVGSFDGQGYEIRDLLIDRPAESNVGLFGVVGGGGVIENVGVVDGKLTGKDSVGGLVGQDEGNVNNSYSTGRVTGKDSVGGLVGQNEGSVSNSYSTGRVTGKDSVGGLVGQNEGSVSNSYSTGRVTGKDSVGGLAGQNEGNVSNAYSTSSVIGDRIVGGLIGRNEGTVDNSYSIGSVTGKSNIGGLAGHNGGTISSSSSTDSVTGKWYVGGLVGSNDATGTVNHTSFNGGVTGRWYVGGLVGQNEGNVSNSSSIGSATGNNNVGGLAGQNSGTVSNSYAAGNADGGKNVGGLIGQNSGTAINSYATGSVTGTWNVDELAGDRDYWSIVSSFYALCSPNGGRNVGGLVGRNEGIVSNSYSTGRVTGRWYVGGLIGRNEGAASNSFWNTQASGQASSGGGTGKTTAQMKDVTTFSGVGWDIIAVDGPDDRNTDYNWNIIGGGTYPLLSWQPV